MSISKAERKAVQEVFNYLGKNPIVFDIGSNKGEWSDIIVDGVAELHLFEPNEILLNYTMVKYADRHHVVYNDKAVYRNNNQPVTFHYFTNQNNGLSGIYHNPKWDHLPMKQKTVKTVTIDSYCFQNEIEFVDLIKIDVEGAEMDVLLGASGMLASGKIKFLQIERAEHIHLSGYTFQNVIDFLTSKGYKQMETDDNENVIFTPGEFTQDWNSEFKKNTVGITCNFALEIGVFEGLTTRYICENLLKPGGRIICVDPLTDEYLPNHPDNHLFKGQFERFIRNTKGYPVELIRKTSRKAFPQLMDYRFDFIYIDGDHTEQEVYNDGMHAIQILADDGHILFDDYEWRTETKRGIDRVLQMISGTTFEVVHKGYQVLVRKNKPE